MILLESSKYKVIYKILKTIAIDLAVVTFKLIPLALKITFHQCHTASFFIKMCTDILPFCRFFFCKSASKSICNTVVAYFVL